MMLTSWLLPFYSKSTINVAAFLAVERLSKINYHTETEVSTRKK